MQALAVALAVLGALALRCIGIRSNSLWLDELLSANFANHPLAETLITVGRFDVHPPLYYLQLSLWMNLGTGDAWLLANSVTWSVLAVVAVAVAARRLGSAGTAPLAAGLLAVAPAAVFYGQQVRMYALIMFLCALALCSALRFLASGRTADLVGSAVTLLAVAYSHAAGIVMTSGVAAYALARALAAGRRDLGRRLIVALSIVGALSVPAIVFSANRSVEHAAAPEAVEILRTLWFLVVGVSSPGAGVPPWAMVACLVAVCAVCLGSRASRLLFTTSVVLPVLAVLTISYALAPIWLERTLMFVVPFACLSVALAVGSGLAKASRAGSVACLSATGAVVATMSLLSILQQLDDEKVGDHKAVATHVAAAGLPGDVVITDITAPDLWSVLWYLAGPGWGSPLDFHHPSDEWRVMLERIGPDWSSRLGLVPTLRSVEADGLTVTATFVDPLPIGDAERVFVIAPGDVSVSPGAAFEPATTTALGKLTVRLWRRRESRSPAGRSSVDSPPGGRAAAGGAGSAAARMGPPAGPRPYGW